jgi:hypothetical protein
LKQVNEDSDCTSSEEGTGRNLPDQQHDPQKEIGTASILKTKFEHMGLELTDKEIRRHREEQDTGTGEMRTNKGSTTQDSPIGDKRQEPQEGPPGGSGQTETEQKENGKRKETGAGKKRGAKTTKTEERARPAQKKLRRSARNKQVHRTEPGREKQTKKKERSTTWMKLDTKGEKTKDEKKGRKSARPAKNTSQKGNCRDRETSRCSRSPKDTTSEPSQTIRKASGRA